MSERIPPVELTNLPSRPRHLNPEDLKSVFGGGICRGNFVILTPTAAAH